MFFNAFINFLNFIGQENIGTTCTNISNAKQVFSDIFIISLYNHYPISFRQFKQKYVHKSMHANMYVKTHAPSHTHKLACTHARTHAQVRTCMHVDILPHPQSNPHPYSPPPLSTPLVLYTFYLNEFKTMLLLKPKLLNLLLWTFFISLL